MYKIEFKKNKIGSYSSLKFFYELMISFFCAVPENCDLTEMPNTLQDRVPKKF